MQLVILTYVAWIYLTMYILHYFISLYACLSDDALQSLDIKVVGKWRRYFQLKCEFYKAYVSVNIHRIIFVWLLHLLHCQGNSKQRKLNLYQKCSLWHHINTSTTILIKIIQMVLDRNSKLQLNFMCLIHMFAFYVN